MKPCRRGARLGEAVTAACAECTRPTGHYDVCSRSPRHRLAEAERELVEACIEELACCGRPSEISAALLRARRTRSVRYWRGRAGVTP